MKLRPAEAADRLSLHIARIVKRLVAAVDDKDRVGLGVKLTRHLISGLTKASQSHLPGTADVVSLADRPSQPGEILKRFIESFQMERPRRSAPADPAARYRNTDKRAG